MDIQLHSEKLCSDLLHYSKGGNKMSDDELKALRKMIERSQAQVDRLQALYQKATGQKWCCVPLAKEKTMITLQEAERRVDLVFRNCSVCLFFQKCALLDAIGEEPEDEHTICEKFINGKGECRLKNKLDTLTITELGAYAMATGWILGVCQ